MMKFKTIFIFFFPFIFDILGICAGNNMDLARAEKEVEELLTSRRYYEALELVNKILSENRGDLKYNGLKIRILAEWGKTGEAIEEYIKLYEQTSKIFPDLLYRIGLGALRNKSNIVKLFSALSVGELGDKEAIPYLHEALKDKDWSIRKLACEGLKKIGDKDSIPFLIELLKDEEALVRIEAGSALAKLGDKRGLATLEEESKSKDKKARRMAISALAEIGDKRIKPFLQEALKNKKERFWAASCLVKLGEKEYITILQEGIKDKDKDVAMEAAIALADIGDEGLITFLQEALKIEKTWLGIPVYKVISAQLAVKVGDERIVPQLIDLLTEKKKGKKFAKVGVISTKIYSSIALGKIGDKKAIPFLIEELKNKENLEIEKVAIALSLWKLIGIPEKK